METCACITADWLVQFHTGYTVDENDYRDIKALCDQFGLELPKEYESFQKSDKETKK